MDSSLTIRAGLVEVIQLLAILVAWENWKERNARIFQQHHSTQESLIAKNKEEARTLCLPGGNRLKEVIWSSPVVEVYDFTPQINNIIPFKKILKNIPERKQLF